MLAERAGRWRLWSWAESRTHTIVLWTSHRCYTVLALNLYPESVANKLGFELELDDDVDLVRGKNIAQGAYRWCDTDRTMGVMRQVSEAGNSMGRTYLVPRTPACRSDSHGDTGRIRVGLGCICVGWLREHEGESGRKRRPAHGDKLFERVRAERSAGEDGLLEVDAAEARESQEGVWRKGNLGTVGVR